MNKKFLANTAIASTLFLYSALSFSHESLNVYHVTVTNVTASHIITPPAIVAHRHGYQGFKIGMPSSEGLAILAETGNPGPFLEGAAADDRVSATAAGAGVIPPGQSLTVEIRAPRNSLFSVYAMLATTNDAFAAATNVRAPKKGRHAHASTYTFDSGSELNNEDCNYIPGPPCNNDVNGNMPGEGFVHMHTGIYGKADLDAEVLDWRGPNMMISIHNAGRP